MSCSLVGGAYRTTWERRYLWAQVFGSHYAIHREDKIRHLVLAQKLATRPKWSWKQAMIWAANRRLPHSGAGI
jgi:hypothetical protein